MTRPFSSSGRGPAALLAATIVVLGALGPSLAPLPPDLQEDVAGARLLPPWSRASAVTLDSGRVLVVTGLSRAGAGWEGWRAGRRVPLDDREVVSPPSGRLYVLGTDDLGRDLASRVFYGLRHSLFVATFSVVIALALGLAVGAASGLAGGWRDGLLMRGVDVLLAVPRLLVFLLLAALFRPSTGLLMLVLGGTTWPPIARLVRAEVLALRGSDLTRAARAAGCSPVRTAVFHLLPQVGPVVAVSAALRFADTILLESALSFLGLGAPPPAVSLGGIIASGRDHVGDAWWIVTWPAAVLAILVVVVRAAVSRMFRGAEPLSVA